MDLEVKNHASSDTTTAHQKMLQAALLSALLLAILTLALPLDERQAQLLLQAPVENDIDLSAVLFSSIHALGKDYLQLAPDGPQGRCVDNFSTI